MKCERGLSSATPGHSMLKLPTLQAMADNDPQVDERHGSAYKNEFNRQDHF
jgi:hypothetical protein